MYLKDLDKTKCYKRPHWETYYIKFNLRLNAWRYDGGGAIGEVVQTANDLTPCSLLGELLEPVPTQVPYTSPDAFSVIKCRFQNSEIQYEYKCLASGNTKVGDLVVVENKGQYSVAKVISFTTTPNYPEEHLRWIFGEVTPTRNLKRTLASDIISSIVNKGN